MLQDKLDDLMSMPFFSQKSGNSTMTENQKLKASVREKENALKEKSEKLGQAEIKLSQIEEEMKMLENERDSLKNMSSDFKGGHSGG